MTTQRMSCLLLVAVLAGTVVCNGEQPGNDRKASRPRGSTYAPREGGVRSYACLALRLREMGFDGQVLGSESPGAQGSTGDPCGPMPNGCGPSAFFALLANCPLNLVCFVDACNVHDICYAICGSSRDDCDFHLFVLMLGICDETFAPETAEMDTCRTIAFIYFVIVRIFGEAPYQNAQDRVCACGPATEALDSRAAPIRLALDPPFIDDDRDLMPDAWERAVGLDRTEIDSFDDPDGDGLVNLAEFIHGTDPLARDTDADGVDDARQVGRAQSSDVAQQQRRGAGVPRR